MAVTPSSAALALLLRGSMTSKEGETPGERGSESYRQSRVGNQPRTELRAPRAPRRLQQEPGSADLAPGGRTELSKGLQTSQEALSSKDTGPWVTGSIIAAQVIVNGIVTVTRYDHTA